MQITDLRIRNFKSIKNLHIADIENALILVGQNNTGKTAVLDAVRAVSGDYQIQQEDFLEDYPNIEIMVKLRITQLCKYYEERNLEDVDRLPRVMPKNVLILKYYSFENYFLNPTVMAQLGIVESEQEFYKIFLAKWKEYLHRISSGKKLTEVLGKNLETTEDVKAHMEEIRIYMRGHNLYDIFYGRYKKQEAQILTQYIELAPREDFADILDSIERFIYFESRKN